MKEVGDYHRLAAIAGSVGPAAAPALVECLRDQDWELRSEVTAALNYLGHDSLEVRSELVAALDHPVLLVRTGAVQALGDTRNGRPPLLGTPEVLKLAGLLKKETDREIRSAVVDALGHAGPRAKPALPALIECLRDPDSLVYENAAGVIGRMGSDARDAVPVLIGRLKRETQDNADDYRRDLEDRKSLQPGDAIPMFYEKHTARETLVAVGPAAIPDLMKSLGDETIRSELVSILGEIARQPGRSWLDRNAPAGLVTVLRQIAGQHAVAVDLLCKYLNDDESLPREAAAEALGNLDLTTQAAEVNLVIPLLISRLADDDPRVRAATAGALGNVWAIRPHVVFGAPGNSYPARAPGGRIRPEAEATVDALAKRLEVESDRSVQARILAALAGLGTDASAAIPVIEKLLQDREPSIRSAATAAIDKISGSTPPFEYSYPGGGGV